MVDFLLESKSNWHFNDEKTQLNQAYLRLIWFSSIEMIGWIQINLSLKFNLFLKVIKTNFDLTLKIHLKIITQNIMTTFRNQCNHNLLIIN